MEVLWGAWVKQVKLDDSQRSIDIIGSYDLIYKKKKSDFPFITDLQVILAYHVANRTEVEQTYQITFDFADRFGVVHPFILTQEITVPSGDLPLRWYETYMFNNVQIREPEYHELQVLIERQFKQRIPLWVIAPKVMIYDPEKDSTTELWPEDWRPEGQSE